MFERAIREGVARGVSKGLQGSLAERCDGYHEPDERCPMKPPFCACRCVQYRKLSWWQQLWADEPPEPPDQMCFDTIMKIHLGLL